MTEQKEKKLREEDLKQLEDNKKRREEIQRKQIQEALNQQTFPHFKTYAEQQHPNNQQAQDDLIKQLQEQHFEQYMNQVYQQQLLHQQQQAEQLRAMRKSQKKSDTIFPDDDQLKKLSLNSSNEETKSLTVDSTNVSFSQVNEQLISNRRNLSPSGEFNISGIDSGKSQQSDTHESTGLSEVNLSTSKHCQVDDDDDDENELELPPISAASMLTRKDIKEFKESVRKDNDAIIKVGSGETVTVRVPTHEDGRLIFWEFSTDFYDLGFGLYFEWTLSPSNNVTVHVSDSSDEEDEEGDEGIYLNFIQCRMVEILEKLNFFIFK